MSTIEKLYIQGVRSFGSNAEDAQSITFSSPITLILGQNGCGKTTIIECLKYALTGECPPGSDSGKNFVHDPKISGRSESLAQIKMDVRDKNNARLSICRSMKVALSRDKKTRQFKTMDSTITHHGRSESKAKNLESMSYRNADTDQAVADFMGVSKAIINSVLFCHQEDSSWPLDEGKKLKDKFDAIFGIVEYNKALDHIISLHKAANEELKVMAANMKHLAYLKKEMDDKTINLQKYEQKCEDIKKQCEKCDEEVKPIDTRLEEIRNVEYEISKYNARKVEMDTTHKNYVEQIAKLSKNIKKLFDGSLVELDLEIQSFNRRMTEMTFQRTDVEEQLSKIKRSHADLQKTLATHDKELYVAKQKYKNEEECKLQLAKNINNFCTKLEVTMDKKITENPEKLEEMIDVTLKSKQREINELSARNDQADQTRQAKIDDLRIDITKSEQSLKSQEKQKNASEQESQELELKIKQIEISVHQLKALDKQITDTDEKYESATRSFNHDECRQTIANKKTSVAEKQARFKSLDQQLTFLNSIAKLMAEITLKEKELEKKNQEVNRVKSKHSDNLGIFFKEPITNNYRRAVQNAYEKLRREIQDLNEKGNAQKLNEQSYEIKRKNLVGDIERMEKEIQQLDERIYQKCLSTPYDELILRSKTTIAKLQLEHGALKSSEAMYKKYIQKIEEQTNCPLCHRDMSGDEACDLTSELTDEIQKLPDNITRSEKLLKTEQSKYEDLLQIKPAIDKVAELKESLPQKRKELENIKKLLADAVAEYETYMSLLGEPTCNMELANSMLGDMTLLDEALKESQRFTKDLDQLKLKLPDNYDASVSVDALQAEKNDVLKQLETESKELETYQQTYEQQTEALNRLRQFRNGLKEKRIKLQEGQQSLPQFKERLEELTRMLITIATEMAELELNIQPLKKNLSAAIEEKARLKKIEQTKLAELNSKYNSYKLIVQDIQRLNKNAQEFASMNLTEKMARLDSTIIITKDEITKLDGEITNCSKKLETIKTECLSQQSLERDLKDNRELKQLQKKEVELAESCAALAKQMGNMNFPNISKEKNELIKKKDAASLRRGELFGQLGEIENHLTKLQLEINKPEYKESLKNYRRALYEVAIKRCGIDDLREHRAALEWALIQFHAEKMNNINSLIRQYWRMIYKGNDIDYIQIKAEEPDSKTGATNRRRVYNYKVMQSKNNSEIEMRGRCSAGQRVLASLIIRMALAETFSSNCGVLALDEPTTNLDRDNIMSLCEALNSIVEERQIQSNFMLIIITHDEEFISSLGKINRYHRVQRNTQCKSVIQMVRVDGK
ncbi:hypothetical protein KR093_002147 [Drosophila rubida]|uniref:Zinc-hook domain-containing protein n=1 Tax=Drosophila rubida TaxID=30044 RepID=A0AAD4JZD6_9MUSC|nr:hypothetical protein KR093_002147 [Drosophila rubida]